MNDKSYAGDLSQVDIYNEQLLECPYEFFARLRKEAPVVKHLSSGVYQVSSYELAKKVLFDPKTFSNEIGHALHDSSTTAQKVGEIMRDAYPTTAVLHTSDGLAHKFSRQLVNRAFSPKRIGALAPRIREVADELIDRFIARGEVELMSEFAQQLPLIIIAEQLGVRTTDLEKFRKWSDAFASRFSYAADEAAQVEGAYAIVEFQQYFKSVLEEKKNNPSDDVISVIAGAVDAGPNNEESLTLAQALQLCQQILVGGNESTAATISEGMCHFLNMPEVIDKVRDDESFRKNAIEELLRVHSAVNTMWRIAAKDTELGGVQIPEGSLILVRFGAANRDDKVFEDGDQFCPERQNARNHIAFGFGIHMCIGAHLARLELDIAFERLFSRLTNWRIREGVNLKHNHSILIRALSELPLEFDAVGAG